MKVKVVRLIWHIVKVVSCLLLHVLKVKVTNLVCCVKVVYVLKVKVINLIMF